MCEKCKNKFYKNKLECPFQCDHGNPNLDSQEHLLLCPKLNPTNLKHTLSIGDSVGEVENQEKIGKTILKIILQRNKLIEEMEHSMPNS